ncbi:glutamate/aspartate transport system permease protein [Variovorax sp. TBS-050B]|uniref:amino acid ABC transporter permease n=1 Tax=Variovorax sp. TBS-050B TaxID=2940551 RepID=UPI002475E188|nr:amino acid ABC transporter permease [Variovorax sp. TBS-050B]MDH6591472.1 glutamate/aspartate transport system permease protein [Variovorax sp. TBS-050B]
MNYDWSWAVFRELSLDGLNTYWEMLMIGVGWTLALALVAWVLALLCGSVLGVMRTVRGRGWRIAVAIYVEAFRSVPLLVQMFLWYFVLPELLPRDWGTAMKQLPQPWGQFLPALACLSFYGSARVAEQVRSGIQSLPRGQFSAATAMGLTEFQRYRHIIVPQAMRIVIPPLTSEFTGIIKYSSVALTIGLLELTGQARSMQEYTFHIFEAFSAATAGYLAINGIVVLGMRHMERRLAVPGLIGAGGRRG